MSGRLTSHLGFGLLCILTVLASGQAGTLFEENFDSVVLGPNADEVMASDAAWTPSGPEGWTVDNSRMPLVDGEVIGTTEWRGWTFADPAWWASVDNQRRSEFTKASGAAAVADPDEWDDVGSPARVGTFESYLVSPSFDVTSAAGGIARLSFDFSWRPWGNQTGNVTLVFDDGDPQEVFRLDTATTTDDMTNESETLLLPIPADATTAVLRFGMFDAGNDWFWAIDNVVVSTAAKIGLWDFEEGIGTHTANSGLGGGLAGTLTGLTESAWSDPEFLGRSLRFQSDGYVDLGTSAMADAERARSDSLRPLSGLTISAWVKTDTFTDRAGIAGSVFHSGASQSGFYLGTCSPNTFCFALATEDEGDLIYLSAVGDDFTGEWAHVVGTYDGREQRFYVNGKLIVLFPTSGRIDYEPAPHGFQIGTFIDDDEDGRFTGEISQVAVWDGALSAVEIDLLYQIGRAGDNIDLNLDSDCDGLPDDWELANFGSLNEQNGAGDPDGDHLNNIGEIREGTNPTDADTDGDGEADFVEIMLSTSATSAHEKPAGNPVVRVRELDPYSLDDWNTADAWSSGESPSRGQPYVVNGKFTSDIATSFFVSDFSGDRLELLHGARLLLLGPASVSELVLNPGIVEFAQSDTRLGKDGDRIQIRQPSTLRLPISFETYELAAKVSGDQPLTVSLTTPEREPDFPTRPKLTLLADNHEFTGCWKVNRTILNPTTPNGLGKADVSLFNGTLDPDANLNLPEQTLTLTGKTPKLILDQDMAFGRVTVGDGILNLEPGTYTFEDLIGLGFTSDNVVDGRGKLIVGGELIPGEDLPPAMVPLALPGLSRNEKGIRLSLPEGESLNVEFSTDLLEWETIGTGVSGTFFDTDTVRTAGKKGFFRVRRP
ncbi:MAG: LamG-like jellyroll fold domain-containing protein [Verrucomicrobiota bacterium]